MGRGLSIAFPPLVAPLATHQRCPGLMPLLLARKTLCVSRLFVHCRFHDVVPQLGLPMLLRSTPHANLFPSTLHFFSAWQVPRRGAAGRAAHAAALRALPAGGEPSQAHGWAEGWVGWLGWAAAASCATVLHATRCRSCLALIRPHLTSPVRLRRSLPPHGSALHAAGQTKHAGAVGCVLPAPHLEIFPTITRTAVPYPLLGENTLALSDVCVITLNEDGVPCLMCRAADT